MNKFSPISLFLIIFTVTFCRIFPLFSILGRDYLTTQESFPFEVANGYGIYNFLAIIINKIGLGFYWFWFIISIIYAYSVYLFYKKILKFEITIINLFILYIFILGFTIPWFAFQNIRYGTALLIIFGNNNTSLKKYILYLFGILLHALVIPTVLIFEIVNKIKNIKALFLIISVFTIIFLINNINLTDFFLKILQNLNYENYSGDLILHEFNDSSKLFPYLRVFALAIIAFLGFKNIVQVKVLLILAIYLSSIIFTPFHGRILPIVYIYVLIEWMYNHKINKLNNFLFYFLLITEGINGYYHLINNDI